MIKTTIYKYPICLEDRQRVAMPRGSVILSAQFQRGQLCLWAQVPFDEKGFRETKQAPTDSGYEIKVIEVFGTGHPIPEGKRRHISTVDDGTFVWHVFELV